MMYDHEKSDPAIVTVKPTNKAGKPAAELVEPRAGAEGNVSQQSTGRAQYRGTVSQALERIRQAARQRKKEKFTALFHHVSIDHLAEAFSELKENAAAGVDGLACKDYAQHLERNLEDLHARVHRGAYRALPSRRVYIPKPDGRQRPIAVAALEDKIVQRATAAVLSAIYEEDFLGLSYGIVPDAARTMRWMRSWSGSPHKGELSGSNAGKAASHQTGTATEHASADSQAGKMVAAGRHRLLQLPRGADQQFVTVRVPIPRYQSLAANAAVAEPKRWMTWERIKRLADHWLPKPRIRHPGRRIAFGHTKPFIRRQRDASPSDTRGGSRVPELGSHGSVRGAQVTRVPTAKVLFTLWVVYCSDQSGTS